jgi:hypothetical protein
MAALIPVDISIGITGTRHKPSNKQLHSLGLLMTTTLNTVVGIREIHHGCAVGIDETAHYIAKSIAGVMVYGHPGIGWNGESPYRMAIDTREFDGLYTIDTYGKRNLAIVRAAQLLIACPRYPESDALSKRSGTWQTIRMARRATTPVILVIPDGRIMKDNPREEIRNGTAAHRFAS